MSNCESKCFHGGHATVLTSITLVAALLLPSLALAAPTTAPTTAPKPVADDAASDESDDAERTLRLHISVRLGRGNQAVEAEVRAQVTKIAQEAGFVVLGAEQESPRLLYIVITRDPSDNATYVVKLAHYLGGVRALRRGAPFGCPSCDGEALIESILVNVAPVLDQLNQELPPPAVPNKAAEPRPVPPPLEPPQQAPGGIGMWTAGTTLTALGSALVVGGGAIFIMSAVDKKLDPSGTVRWAILGSGVALLATGIPLVMTGRKRMRRAGQTLVSAGYNGRMATVALTGRF